MPSSNEIATAFFHALAQRSEAALVELLAPSATLMSWGPGGVAGHRPRARAVARLLADDRLRPDARIEVVRTTGDEEGIWAEVRIQAVQDGRLFDGNRAVRLEVREGKITEIREYAAAPIPGCYRDPQAVPDRSPTLWLLEMNAYAADARSLAGDEIDWTLSREVGRQYLGNQSPGLNRVWGARFTDEDADLRIHESIAHFRALDSGFVWQVHPLDTPHDLPTRLERAGLQLYRTEQIVALRTTVSVGGASGVTVETVDPDQSPALDEICSIFLESQLIPGAEPAAFRALIEGLARTDTVHLFLARLEGQAAGAGLLSLSGVACLAGGAVRSTFQRRGVYRSLVQRRLELAAKNGRTLAYVEATHDSYPMLTRLGFEEHGSLRLYRWEP